MRPSNGLSFEQGVIHGVLRLSRSDPEPAAIYRPHLPYPLHAALLRRAVNFVAGALCSVRLQNVRLCVAQSSARLARRIVAGEFDLATGAAHPPEGPQPIWLITSQSARGAEAPWLARQRWSSSRTSSKKQQQTLHESVKRLSTTMVSHRGPPWWWGRSGAVHCSAGLPAGRMRASAAGSARVPAPQAAPPPHASAHHTLRSLRPRRFA